MGYYTTYELDYQTDWREKDRLNLSIAELQTALEKGASGAVKAAIENELETLKSRQTEDPDVEEGLRDLVGYDPLPEPCKWYDSHEDMLQLSLKFPGVLLILTGYGEDKDDIWRAYYKDGKSFKTPGKIVFDSFDESKLS